MPGFFGSLISPLMMAATVEACSKVLEPSRSKGGMTPFFSHACQVALTKGSGVLSSS